MTKNLCRLTVTLLMPCLMFAGMPQDARASIVSTEQAMDASAGQSDRAKLMSFLSRADVQASLQSQGLSAADAMDRVHALSDAEVAQLSSRVDSAPAGAGVVGVLFTVFLVLLVTDIMGLTKVFPFTRSVR